MGMRVEMMITIETKDQLKKAKEDKVREFVVVGDLAEKLYKTRKISKLSKKAAIALSSAVGGGAIAAPFTGGGSLMLVGALATSATATIGGSQVVIVALGIGGIIALYALYKDYDMTFEVGIDGKMSVVCKKKD